MPKGEVNTGKLADAINQTLYRYRDDVAEVIAVSAEEVAKECAEQLKKTSPRGVGKGAGAYAKSWRVIEETHTRIQTRYRVYNKDHYQLTHLLEKGHAKVNGGRTRAFPHIEPAEQQAEKALLEKIERGLQQ